MNFRRFIGTKESFFKSSFVKYLKDTIFLISDSENSSGELVILDSVFQDSKIIDKKIADINTQLMNINNNINKILNELYPLKINLDLYPNISQKYTSKNVLFTLNWEITLNNENIIPDDINLNINDVLYSINTNDNYYKFNINKTSLIKFIIKYKERIITKELNIEFIYPSYTGVVDDDFIINESNILSLSEMNLINNKEQTYTYSEFISKKIIYAYAKSYGELEHIIDENNIDLKDKFIRQELIINDIEYYVYIYNELISNLNLKILNFK